MNENTKAIISAVVSIIVVVAGMLNVAIDENTIMTIVSGIVVLLVVIYDIWKNHNFTSAAKQGQRVTDALKQGDLDESEINAVFEADKHTED